MRLATIHSENSRDGQLIIVDQTNKKGRLVPPSLTPNLITALENWAKIAPELQNIYEDICNNKVSPTLKLEELEFRSPLPRTYGFLDGSAYLSHVERVRKSRCAEMPPELREIPLMYQGISDCFLDPDGDIPIIDEKHGVDFEAEIAVITDYVPIGIKAAEALPYIKLILLLNDISLRNLIPAELARGFGFLHGKPASACAPIAITPDELGAAWQNGRADLVVQTTLNNKVVGNLDTKEMHFSFAQLIEHAARTRSLSAGTIIGSGTVSNKDESKGIGCLVEKRVLEIINEGQAKAEYLKVGDQIEIKGLLNGVDLFGSIKQVCSAYNI